MGLAFKKCCCFELKIGVMAIGIVLAVIAALEVVYAIVTMIARITSGIAGGIHLICGTIQLISNIFLLIGCSNFKKSFLKPWLIVYALADVAYFLLALVMIGMGARVWDGTPQDEKVITLTGLTGYDFWTSGYTAVVVGPILALSAGLLTYFWLVTLSFYKSMGLSTINHP